VELTFAYVGAWIAGGLLLAALLIFRPERQPYALALALIGFGAGGFAMRTAGFHLPQITLQTAAVAALGAAALGYLMQRLR
jgi:hypothetical protein